MLFKFNINLSDQDYLDYNIFWMIKSPYGKKQLTKYRIIIAVFFLIISFLSLFGGGFSGEAFLSLIPLAIVFLFIQLTFNYFLTRSLKSQLKTLKKNGKMGYSAMAQMEFNEDSFVELTANNKTEQQYSSIERISVIDGKTVYIHVNNVMAYLLPISCFESKAQYDKFLEFIKTKCSNIDSY